MQFKSIPYLHKSVSAGTHERVHHTIKGVVMRVSSHMTHSFTCEGKGGSIKCKKYNLGFIFMMTGSKRKPQKQDSDYNEIFFNMDVFLDDK